jgi:hypothetical protein
MSRTTRRIDKKRHQIHEDSILLSMLSAHQWKERILALEVGQELRVDATTAIDRDDDASVLLRGHRLKYVLTRLAPTADTEPEAFLFRLAAVEHPTVMVYAEEHPDVIGTSEPSPRYVR